MPATSGISARNNFASICATRALQTIAPRILIPALGILLVSGGCAKETCGFSNPAFACRELYKNENASSAIGVRIELARAQLTIDDTATVIVISRNYGKKTWIVPTQTCAPSIQIFESVSPDSTAGPIIYPPANFICNGESYPGATLAPGDSMIVRSDLMAILTKVRKDANRPLEGKYGLIAHVRVDERSVNYARSVYFSVTPKP